MMMTYLERGNGEKEEEERISPFPMERALSGMDQEELKSLCTGICLGVEHCGLLKTDVNFIVDPYCKHPLVYGFPS